MSIQRLGRCLLGAIAAAVLGVATLAADPSAPVKVQITEEKPVIVEAALPIDPTVRIKHTPSTRLGMRIRDEQNRTLHLSHYATLSIDGKIVAPGTGEGGRFEKQNQPLPPRAGGKPRHGTISILVLEDLRITMTAEVAPCKAQSGKRKLETVLVRYEVENNGKTARKLGVRVYIDMYVATNDGALFAAPTMPDKILDGIELKDKTLPAWVQCMQQPNLQNPGVSAFLTLDLGSALEKADRVVLTRHGAAAVNNWDVPAVRSGGDSGMAFFFDPKEIRPGGKREFGYAYGTGIATAPENEGRVEWLVKGSFEPGKEFKITARVHDPVPGQSLILELPRGIRLVEGRDIQPVPAPLADYPISLVHWTCSVRDLGDFPIRLRSSTGVTQTKRITVSRGE